MKHLILFLFVLLPLPSIAHETETHYDRIHLSASAQQQVDNDTIIATLYAEEEGSTPSRLADSINKKIKRAVDTLKKHRDIKLQTNSYTTSPVYHKNKINRWRVRQSIRLESQNMAKVSELLGELQQTLALQGMHFAVSPQLKTQTDDALITEALAAFEQRANLIAKQLRRNAYKIVDINVSTAGGGRNYKNYARVAMMESSVAAPAVEAGEQTMQVTVSGNIELE